MPMGEKQLARNTHTHTHFHAVNQPGQTTRRDTYFQWVPQSVKSGRSLRLAASHLRTGGTGDPLNLPTPSHSRGLCNRVATPAEIIPACLDPPHPSPGIYFKLFFFLAIQAAGFQPLTLRRG